MKRPILAYRLLPVGLLLLAMIAGVLPTSNAVAASSSATPAHRIAVQRHQSDQSADAEGAATPATVESSETPPDTEAAAPDNSGATGAAPDENTAAPTDVPAEDPTTEPAPAENQPQPETDVEDSESTYPDHASDTPGEDPTPEDGANHSDPDAAAPETDPTAEAAQDGVTAPKDVSQERDQAPDNDGSVEGKAQTLANTPPVANDDTYAGTRNRPLN